MTDREPGCDDDIEQMIPLAQALANLIHAQRLGLAERTQRSTDFQIEVEQFRGALVVEELHDEQRAGLLATIADAGKQLSTSTIPMLMAEVETTRAFGDEPTEALESLAIAQQTLTEMRAAYAKIKGDT